MSRVPMAASVLPGSDTVRRDCTAVSEGLVRQGISAGIDSAEWGFSRQQLDEFFAGSHEKAAAATKGPVR